MTPAKQHSRGHRNIIATSARHQQSITKTRPRHHRDTPRHHPSNKTKTKTRPRHVREHEFFNLEASSVDIWATATRKGAQSTNSNWNLRFCLETQSKCSSMFITKKSKHHHQSKKQHCNINDTTPSHHPLIIKTSQHHHHTSRRLHRTCPRRHQHITERSPKHHQQTNKTTPKQPRDITKRNRDRDITETSPKQHRDITETRQRQDQERTETQPRHDRDKTETSRRQGSIIGRHTGHSYTGLPKGAQYTNSKWNLRFCLKTRSKCSHQKIKTQSPKQKKQHCNINDKTPSHHPLIIINITAPSPHITETSPKHARDVANDQRITERSPKHHPKTNKTTPKQQLDITKKRQRQDRDTTET